MEVTYAEPEAGGPITANFIPELSQLAEENINFSHTDGLGGAHSFSGTTWTAAALVSQTSGVAVQVPLNAGRFGGADEDSEYMPGVVSIGEILEDAGYQQMFLMGSDAEFGGRNTYFSDHGNYELLDTKALKAAGRLPEDYDIWWGFEDKKLWDYAKEELTRLGESDQPFNFTMLTCDSHFPNGYKCEDCGNEYSAKYPNVLHCCSVKVKEFIDWCKEQPFYENTTIVLCGDHLTMDPNFFADVNPDYKRTIYNCIINAPIDPVNEKNRSFGTYDMFPTTLAALGVEIEGNRLGLGTNLFSDLQTLSEIHGEEFVDYELQKNSDFYNSRFLGMYPMPGKKED
jgi:phosphoglycerol transferase